MTQVIRQKGQASPAFALIGPKGLFALFDSREKALAAEAILHFVSTEKANANSL